MKLAQIPADYGTQLQKKNLDKDRFRKDLGDLIPAYTLKLQKDWAYYMNSQMYLL